MIKKIDGSKCDVCELRIKDTCPIQESCFQDVIRLDKERKPHMKYARDCCNCHASYWYACREDCPYGAVVVTSLIRFTSLPF